MITKGQSQSMKLLMPVEQQNNRLGKHVISKFCEFVKFIAFTDIYKHIHGDIILFISMYFYINDDNISMNTGISPCIQICTAI